MSYYPTKTTVLIKKLKLDCCIGITEDERAVGQILHVDVACVLNPPMIGGDEINQTVSYSTLVKKIRELATDGKERKLLETLADDIAKVCLNESRVCFVEVTIFKPAKMQDVEAVGVIRSFAREGRWW